MKRLLYSGAQLLASVFAFIAIMGVKPYSTIFLYEPEIPEELMR